MLSKLVTEINLSIASTGVLLNSVTIKKRWYQTIVFYYLAKYEY